MQGETSELIEPPTIDPYEEKISQLKQKQQLAKERLAERRTLEIDEEVVISVQDLDKRKDYLNRSGLDQINDEDEDAASNSPKSEGKVRSKGGAWSTFTKFFKKESVSKTVIKEEKLEESVDKPFDEFSVREVNESSMVLTTDPGE